MYRGVLAVVVLSLVVGVADAQRTAYETKIEAEIRVDVVKAGDAAAAAYDEGNAARDAQDIDGAIGAYRKLIAIAPDLDHGHRRLCTALMAKEEVAEGFAECEKALALQPSSPWNEGAMAQALMIRGRGEDRRRAFQLARSASDAAPDDLTTAQRFAVASASVEDGEALGRSVRRLMRLDPDGVVTNMYAAISVGNEGDYDSAREHLRKAKAAGLDDATYDELRGIIDRAEDDANPNPFPISLHTLLWVIVPILVVWLAAMLALLIAGTVLSRKTLATVEETATSKAGDGAGNAREQRLRRIYRGVLLVSGIYFYLSMPILFGIVVLGGCSIVIAFMALGFIPIKLVLLIGLVMFGTIGAILRSLFTRSKFEAPGPHVDFAKNPRLRELVDDVAAVVGTRAVDVAYVTAGTEMGVTERGGLWSSLRGKKSERVLIMGIGLFEGMTQHQLRSILAHEYGHFRNADTAGGGFALAVRRSLYSTILHLASSGAAGSFNPVWWFLRAFHRMYLGISQGASRLQEVLADRWAIQAYGSKVFVDAYTHTVARSVEFDHEVDAKLREVIENKWGLPNLYAYKLESQLVAKDEVAAEIDKQMKREPDVYDSHPSSAQRIRWAEVLDAQGRHSPDGDAPVWDLFVDREELERSFTARIREDLQVRRGIEIPATDDEDFEDESGASKPVNLDESERSTADAS